MTNHSSSDKQDVRRCCPHAVEYVALDDSLCWLRGDPAELLAERGGVP
jgi:hypothetical protein